MEAHRKAIVSAAPDPSLARSASILGLGSIASRVLGLARDTIISYYFGSSGQLSAFNLAARVPTMVYDLLVGGMLSAALVPVFSDYARPERRHELAKVAGAVLSMLACAMGMVVLLLEVFAAPIANVLGDFSDPELQATLTRLLRLIAPAVLLFGLSGALTGLLYALKRFSYTAASAALFNLGIVIAAPLLARHLHIYALPIGIVGGSLIQLLVLLPGLRDLRLRFTAAWGHPAVQRILRLYVPIAVGLIVSQVQIVIDGRWASSTGEQSVSWMRYATTLIQLPLGLVPVAVSLAALPTLSQRAADEDWDAFRSIFGRGLRLVLVLLIPAAVGLYVLSEPMIRLLFEHGNFLSADTQMTAMALRLYLLGLLFAGVDFMFNYTFYARQDTRTPAIVGMISVVFYFVAARALLPLLGFLGLVLADSVKQASHAIIMFVLLTQSVGRLGGQRVWWTSIRAVTAGGVMGVCVWWASNWLGSVLPGGLMGELAVVLLSAGAGAALYVLLLAVLGVTEVTEVVAAAARRLRSVFFLVP